jgi:hypothetical protein
MWNEKFLFQQIRDKSKPGLQRIAKFLLQRDSPER